MGFADFAQKYYELGFSIMPLRKGDKKPLLAWESFQKQRVTQEQLDEWCRVYPDANIAIITGRVSNLVVLDIDGPEGAEAVQKKGIPQTRLASTGKGKHFYFRMPPDRTIGNAVGIMPQVDVRGEGGYVVAPGSVHPNGTKYEWVFEDEICDLPIWLYEAQKQERQKVSPADDAPSWLEKVKQGVSEGGRNDAAARLAGHYIRKGYAPGDILDLLSAWNHKNTPPLSDKEIEAVVKSIMAKDPSTGDGILDAAPTGLAEAKAVLAKWLYFKDDTMIDVALATVASLYHPSDPLWVVLVGPPSSGKTEILRALDRHADTYFIDNLTPATFVTGFTKAKGILERMGEDKKTFVLQDLSTLISKPPYDRMQIVDQLRQIYNGSYYNEWGNGKKFAWKGKVGLVAGCTPEIEAHHIAMGELGERFLYYRTDADDDETRTKMMQKARAMEGSEKQAREEISLAVHGVIAAIKGKAISSITVEEQYWEWLMSLVDMTTTLRSSVKRNPYHREVVEYTPHKEGPGRMYKACQVLIKSLALVRGRTNVTEQDYEVVAKVCIDSIPSVRRESMRAMIKVMTNGGGGVRAKDVAKMTGYQSTESINIHLADLCALGIVDRWVRDNANVDSAVGSPWLYEIKQPIFERMEKCGLVDII